MQQHKGNDKALRNAGSNIAEGESYSEHAKVFLIS
jgi:hypothetical protein